MRRVCSISTTHTRRWHCIGTRVRLKSQRRAVQAAHNSIFSSVSAVVLGPRRVRRVNPRVFFPADAKSSRALSLSNSRLVHSTSSNLRVAVSMIHISVSRLRVATCDRWWLMSGRRRWSPLVVRALTAAGNLVSWLTVASLARYEVPDTCYV